MARIKIELPETFSFSTIIPIRITDLNYGGHVGNDTVLSIIHEARLQFLAHHNSSELQFFGTGLIMSDVAIEYKIELFYNEAVKVSISAGDLTRVSFDLYYLLEKQKGEKWIKVAVAKTGMACFNYQTKRLEALPEEAKRILS